MTVHRSNRNIETNIIKNCYVINGSIWIIDEIAFNKNTKLFLIVNIKTQAIINYST